MTVSWSYGPHCTHWLTRVCGTKSQSSELGNVVRVKGNVSCTWLNSCVLHKQKRLPYSSLAEIPLDHYQSSTKFHRGYETLWLVGLSKSKICLLSKTVLPVTILKVFSTTLLLASLPLLCFSLIISFAWFWFLLSPRFHLSPAVILPLVVILQFLWHLIR